MKKILYIPIMLLILVSTSCSDDFLEQKNLYEVYDTDFYKTPQDIDEALTAAYACLPSDEGANNAIVVANLMSDDCFGGGGINDLGFHDIDGFTQNSGEDIYLNLWEINYKGIFRANMIISRFDQAEYDNLSQKNQALGEAHFLRAYFYLRLTQYFGSVPLKIEPNPDNLPKAEPADIFALIASDLKLAIDIMPNTEFGAISTDRLGHANKWAAEALMARAFLYYTGYYDKTELPLQDGTSIGKAQVITWLDDCIDNSGHGLISDFRELWPYSYATDTTGGYEYPFARNNSLQWIGEDGNNIETIFAIKYSPYGGWNDPKRISYSNQLCLYMGMRGQEGLMPFGTGWGGGTVNPQLYESYDDNDVRKKGSVADVTDPEEGNVSTDYVWGVWEAMHETGLWQKKYTPIQIGTGTALKGMYFTLLGSPDDFQLWNMQDEVLIRFSDVLLMAAELKEDVNPLNDVRTRADLDPLATYSLDALKEERRHELAFEGLRYFDLQRWHDAETAFANVKNIPVKNMETDELYTSTYRSETKGFLQIPNSQILLSEGVLEQNPGW